MKWCIVISRDILAFMYEQLDEHFSRPMKELVSLCLKKIPAEVNHFSSPELWFQVLVEFFYVVEIQMVAGHKLVFP